MELEIYQSITKILEPKIIEPKKATKNSKHILLVHGFATDSRSWKLFVEKNKKNYIHLINLPGHGSIEYSWRELDFEFIVNTIVQYILEIDSKKVILMGHSFGAGISLVVNEKLFKMGSSKVDKLILLAPYTKYSIPKVYNKIPLFNVKSLEDFLQLQDQIFSNPMTTLQKLKEYLYEKESVIFFKEHWKYLKFIIFQMSRPSTFSKINNAMEYINKNTYILLGEHDRLVPSEILTDKFRTINPSIYISLYRECGHGFFVEKDSYFFLEIEKIISMK